MKRILVCGAGGFIAGHLIKHLKKEKNWIRGVDLKEHEYMDLSIDDFLIGDLRNPDFIDNVFNHSFDEVYQFAADMGGAGFVFTGENDTDIMHNSAMINLNVIKAAINTKAKKIFYSSSACIYPEYNQMDPHNPNCSEVSAYPADPDSEYGWEKLFSERLYLAAKRNYGMNIRIARLHNIFGPQGTWNGGREKAPAAICRKVAEKPDRSEIEIWGDGNQTRSFLYIDECIEGIVRLMNSNYMEPVNIGSDEMVSINKLVEITMKIAGKNHSIKYVSGPEGVRGRNSDNVLINEVLGWSPNWPLYKGMEKTYEWILRQIDLNN